MRLQQHVARLPPKLAVDGFQKFFELLDAERLTAAEHFGHPHGAERRRTEGFDKVARGQDDFRAAAADVGHGHVLAFEIEVAGDAEESQPCFLLGADDRPGRARPLP